MRKRKQCCNFNFNNKCITVLAKGKYTKSSMKGSLSQDFHFKDNNSNIKKLLLFKHLADKSPQDLITQFGLDEYFPVNLSPVFKYNNIVVKAVDFRKLEKRDPNISKKVCTKGPILSTAKVCKNKICIYCNENDSIERQSFAVAGELAMCCLHPEEIAFNTHITYKKDLTHLNFLNSDVYLFACSLLIPQSIIDDIYDIVAVPDVDVIAGELGVPIYVLKNYLAYLNKDYHTSLFMPLLTKK